MLRSIKQLYGDKLGASDGEIGQVTNFYFDDQTWAVRYLVADTGTWLPGRQVLFSPHALSDAYLAGNVLRLNLTRKQIEASPSLEWHKPVSRQFEEAYYRYYGWPCYWQGDGLWGMSGFPISKTPAKPRPNRQAGAQEPQPKHADALLRSTREVKGYHLQTGDGIMGHVSDFMMDAQSWAIRQLVIKTGHQVSGREVQIPTRKVDRINYDGIRELNR
jgi:sporulation protein YlmC with PRC-barrel domain